MVERAPDLADLNPEFSSRLDAFKAALDKASIGYTINSGYRSPEYQNRMYANHLAKQAGQPLPYQNDEAPDVVAPAWRSFHNYGLATDFTLKNPADYARLASMAPQFGLTGIGSSDPGHIQLAGDLASDINQYHLASWRPSSQPAPASGAIAYSALTGPARPTSPTPTQTTMYAGLNADARGMKNNNPGNLVANDWTASLPGYKGSDGKFAIFDTPQHGALALDQNLAHYGTRGINTPLAIASTWAPASDNNDPNSYGAQIAKSLGVGLNDKVDINDPTVRSKISQSIALVENGPGKSAGFAVGVPGSPAAASAAPTAPPNPFTAFAPGGAAAPGGAVASSLTNLDKALGGQQPGQQQQGGRALDMQASPMIPGPGAVNVSPLFNPMLGQQMMAQLSRAPARPAQQAPIGTTLNSMAMLDTSPVQFPQVYPSQMGYGGSGYGMGSMGMSGYPSSGGYGYGG